MSKSKPEAVGAPPAPRFVDSHCHLDDADFAGDLDEVLASAAQAGVTRWINVGFNPERWQPSIALAARHQGMSFMLGVHPGNADCWSDAVHSSLRHTIETHRPVAVGEIGLDFFRGETNGDQQRRAFNAQLDLALDADLPVVIHMRDAELEILEVLQSRTALPNLLFHSFDGTSMLTDWVVAAGAHVGVGGLATRSKSDALRNQLKRIPLDQIVLETDSPYLVPNGFRHRRNTPESIPTIAAMLARTLDRSVDDIARFTTANAERFFKGLSQA